MKTQAEANIETKTGGHRYIVSNIHHPILVAPGNTPREELLARINSSHKEIEDLETEIKQLITLHTILPRT